MGKGAEIRRSIEGVAETIRRNDLVLGSTTDPVRRAEIEEDTEGCRETIAALRLDLVEAEDYERIEALPDDALEAEWEASREAARAAGRDPAVGEPEYSHLNLREARIAAIVRRRHGIMGG